MHTATPTRATDTPTIYEKAAALCRAKPVTIIEAVLLCSLAFAGGYTLAIGLAMSVPVPV